MERRTLGRTGMEVSPIGFGASPLGGEFGAIDEQNGIDAVHEALRSGVNYFDVSPYYGRTRAETVLGKALGTLPRDSFYLGTKVGRYDSDNFDFSAARVVTSVEESMKRLQVDRIDTVLCHDIEFGDLDQIVNETIPALHKLKESGKIRAIGISAYPLNVYKYVLDRSTIPLDVVLSYCHGCLNDTSLLDMIPYFQSKGVGVINASAICMGLLTQSGGPDWHPAPESVKVATRAAARHCAEKGADLADLALRYALSIPSSQVQTTLVGIGSVNILQKNLEAMKTPPDATLLAEVQGILAPVLNSTWTSGRPENQL